MQNNIKRFNRTKMVNIFVSLFMHNNHSQINFCSSFWRVNKCFSFLHYSSGHCLDMKFDQFIDHLADEGRCGHVQHPQRERDKKMAKEYTKVFGELFYAFKICSSRLFVLQNQPLKKRSDLKSLYQKRTT